MMKKALNPDHRGEDTVMYPFVLIIALVAIMGFLLSGIMKYGESGDMSQIDYPEMAIPF